MSAVPPVVIVGAGPAGLAAGGALRRAGVESVLLERGPAVATSWRSRHEGLRLNTIRWQSGLPGLRIPRSAGRWVSRDDYVSYLERYAAAHRLDIRPGVHVQRLDPVDDGWRVTTSAGAGETSRVVVATGHDRVPWLPEWPGRGSFLVPVMHVSGLQRPSDLAGLRVLLVGAGNSGVEIGGHLVDAGVAGLWVSVRTPPNLMPREIAGVPVQPAGVPLTRAPERLADSVGRLLSRLAFGDLSGYGLPAPELGPYARLRLTGEALAVDEGFVAHLQGRPGHGSAGGQPARRARRSCWPTAAGCARTWCWPRPGSGAGSSPWSGTWTCSTRRACRAARPTAGSRPGRACGSSGTGSRSRATCGCTPSTPAGSPGP